MPKDWRQVALPVLAIFGATFYVTILQIQDALNPTSVVASAIVAIVAVIPLVQRLTAGPRFGVSKDQLDQIRAELVAAKTTLYSHRDRKGQPILKTPACDAGLHVWLIPRMYRGGRLTRIVLHALPTWVRPNMGHLIMEPEYSKTALSGIPWVFGRGPIGQSWKYRSIVRVDFSRYTTFSRKEWRALRREERLGMRYKHLRQMVKRYGSVLVVPLMRHHGDQVMLGCLVLDAPAGKRERFDAVQAAETLALIGSEKIAPLIP